MEPGERLARLSENLHQLAIGLRVVMTLTNIRLKVAICLILETVSGPVQVGPPSCSYEIRPRWSSLAFSFPFSLLNFSFAGLFEKYSFDLVLDYKTH
jgi:hypothetical protein